MRDARGATRLLAGALACLLWQGGAVAEEGWEGHYARAKASGDPAEEIREYEAAARAGGPAHIWISVGTLWGRQGRWQKAVGAYERALQAKELPAQARADAARLRDEARAQIEQTAAQKRKKQRAAAAAEKERLAAAERAREEARRTAAAEEKERLAERAREEARRTAAAKRAETPPAALPAAKVAAKGLPKTARRPAMVPIARGMFWMGSPADEADRGYNEGRHQVRLTRGFLLGETEVTQGQYEAVTGENPSGFEGDKDLPVEKVSWLDAVAYCNKLSELEGLERCYKMTGEEVQWPRGLGCKGYRLPTEAEWEYAARAGTALRYAGSKDTDGVAWYNMNSDHKTHPVRQKGRNGWGLYDMSGNVWEWIWDWYGDYPAGVATDPTGPGNGNSRVNRGGSSWGNPKELRVAYRDRFPPGGRNGVVGFRLSRSLP